MAKIILIIVVIVILCCVALLLLPIGRAHENPPVTAEPAWDSAGTRALFMRVCGDCHSNETIWPWYSNIPPVSWLVQRDVDEGRAAFNASEWGRPENEGEESAELFQEGEMPPGIFLALHPEARLAAAERQALLQGLVNTFGGESGSSEGGGEEDDE